jgi:hypothetical protein
MLRKACSQNTISVSEHFELLRGAQRANISIKRAEMLGLLMEAANAAPRRGARTQRRCVLAIARAAGNVNICGAATLWCVWLAVIRAALINKCTVIVCSLHLAIAAATPRAPSKHNESCSLIFPLCRRRRRRRTTSFCMNEQSNPRQAALLQLTKSMCAAAAAAALDKRGTELEQKCALST